jgi:exopolyphosphatase/guanosine-5'-triphosphate,3'-diphosphate pyrophosphatase
MPSSPTDIERVAVIDIGSNTVALAVYAASRLGSIDRVAERSEPLRLMRRLDADGRLPAAALDRTVEVLGEMVGTARENGAGRVDVVATSAVRDARNGDELARRLRDAHGLRMRVLDGPAEGVAAACGAVNTLPLVDGFVVDLGGGSLQIVEVRARVCVRSESLPLGALRLTDRFRTEGLPGPGEITALRRHVQEQLRRVPWFRAAPDRTLVGVGGTVRAIAKTERRATAWPVGHGHGFRLTFDAVEAAWERFSRLDANRRRDVPGLASHRVETIVAGVGVVAWALRASGFEELRTSSYGVREGVALQRLLGEDAPLLVDARAAGLFGRLKFDAERHPAGCDAASAARVLFDAVAPVAGLSPALREPVAAAAHVTAVTDGEARRDAPDRLLAAPLQGFWQEEAMAASDLLAGAPRHGLGGAEHRRGRALAELAAAGRTGAAVEATATDRRLTVSGLRLGAAVERRFEDAFGLRLRAPP